MKKGKEGERKGGAEELVERWKKVKVCKIRFALSSPTLGKLFRIEETFCLEIYILRDVYIFILCTDHWNAWYDETNPRKSVYENVVTVD